MAFYFNTNGGFITCASQQVRMRLTFSDFSTNCLFSESNAILALQIIPMKETHHLMLNGLDYLLAVLAAIAAGGGTPISCLSAPRPLLPMFDEFEACQLLLFQLSHSIGELYRRKSSYHTHRLE
jgi:hypothetical protein